MGKKGGRKVRAAPASDSLDSLGAEFSELFRTLPPGKRAELTKLVEKLAALTANLSSEPLTPAKQWEEFREVNIIVIQITAIR